MHSFLKDDKGSFTLEATLVFPGFLMFTLVCVFFCIIVFQIGTANFVAQKAASQVAYTWNNSYKDLETGEFDKSRYPGIDKSTDGLYWRIFDNNILEIFGLADLTNLFGNGGLVGVKETNANMHYNHSMNVQVKYHNSIIYGEVEAEANSTLFIPSFVKSALGKGEVKAHSSRVVVDTPELIRNFNFVKYIWNESGLGNVLGDIKKSIKDFF